MCQSHLHSYKVTQTGSSIHKSSFCKTQVSSKLRNQGSIKAWATSVACYTGQQLHTQDLKQISLETVMISDLIWAAYVKAEKMMQRESKLKQICKVLANQVQTHRTTAHTQNNSPNSPNWRWTDPLSSEPWNQGTKKDDSVSIQSTLKLEPSHTNTFTTQAIYVQHGEYTIINSSKYQAEYWVLPRVPVIMSLMKEFDRCQVSV